MSPFSSSNSRNSSSSPTIRCTQCSKILSSNLIKSRHIIHCPMCPNAVYCSTNCQHLDLTAAARKAEPSHECLHDWDWFWNCLPERFGSDYLKERQFRCATWALMCMLNCQNQKQRDFIYKLLCCVQPVNDRWIAVLMEEHRAVQQNEKIHAKYWMDAEKIIKYWNEHHDEDQEFSDDDSDSSSSDDSDDESLNTKMKNLSTKDKESPSLPMSKIINQNTFKNAQKWFLNERTQKDVLQADSAGAADDINNWEDRDWKILGANLLHVQIGSWIPDRSFDHQFRLRVDLHNRALQYHFFTFKATNWKDLEPAMQQSLISGNEKTKCLFFLNELERYVNNSRHGLMHIPIDSIEALSAHSTKVDELQDTNSHILVIDLKQPPRFFEESPLDYTGRWKETADFTTNQEASEFSRHFLVLKQPECDKLVSLILSVAGKDSDLYRRYHEARPKPIGGQFKKQTKESKAVKTTPFEFFRNPKQ